MKLNEGKKNVFHYHIAFTFKKSQFHVYFGVNPKVLLIYKQERSILHLPLKLYGKISAEIPEEQL